MTNIECANELQAEKAVMMAVATGGPRIQEMNEEYAQRRLKIHAYLLSSGIQDPNPYDDLWAWYGKWSSGDLPTYRSRRQYLSELFQPALSELSRRAAGLAPAPVVEPTGWPRVDRGVDGIRQRLDTSRNEEEFQTVGLLCRETLISLAQAVYDPAKHAVGDEIAASSTDAYRMLKGYLRTELAGGSNEVIRAHAKAALKLANELQHRRTADLRHAATVRRSNAERGEYYIHRLGATLTKTKKSKHHKSPSRFDAGTSFCILLLVFVALPLPLANAPKPPAEFLLFIPVLLVLTFVCMHSANKKAALLKILKSRRDENGPAR